MSAPKIPVDWPSLFKEAGIAPTPCKLARSVIAQAWCLFVSVPNGVELHIITPPNGAVAIKDGHWIIRRTPRAAKKGSK